MNDLFYMERALELAVTAAESGEVPVGAVVVINGEIIGEGYNQVISSSDPTAHAEIVALRNAAKHLQNYRLPAADLYVTIEPCSMCAGALVHSRIKRLIYGATETRAGVAKSQASFFENEWLNHKVEVIAGVKQQEAAELMRSFFKQRRK